MAHAVSALYAKFNRMSPAALALAALLHVAVALAMLWVAPTERVEAAEPVIEFTVDTPNPPAPPEAAPAPPASPAAAQVPTPQAAAQPRLGLPPPRSLTPDPRATPAPPGPASPTQATEQAQAPPAEPPPPEPQQQQAAAAPPPPPPPSLEQVLPPVDAPPPPLTALDFPKPPPPPKPQPPPPQQRAQTPPPPPQQQLRPSPLSQIPQQRPAPNAQAAAQPAPSPLTNPASQYGQRKAEDDYLWLVMRKLSQYRYYPKSRETSEEGVVVMRITVARDGRLLSVALSKSSGYPTLDTGVMDTVRQASPFAPLPPEISGASHTFILPVNYAHQGPR